ncbi:MAG: DEAD/DEAH box helicase [Actinobacteria bacterium]|nr:DEAD/DEAH box helicase [Actinomycetota bacterium]
MAAIDGGRSVLVAAPTASGKTVVAEHAIDRALADGHRTFYTTPLKALSNQKFRDLNRRLDTGNVGLLTGDNTVRGDAPVVVMTTEVLRNMLYAGAGALEALGCVVLDEVHFLEDPYRGPVWEEVVLGLADGIQLVALSATVSNADELGEWLCMQHGPTDVVVEHRRPVPLRSHYLVGEHRKGGRVNRLPVLVKGRSNREGSRYDAEPGRSRNRGGPGGQRRPSRRWRTPRRDEVLRELQRRDLLPAINFIFSRAGCEEARDKLVRDGIRLTDQAQATEIAEVIDNRMAGLSEEDLGVLGVAVWREGLERGIASHHAGMLPLFKEVTEELFGKGLIGIIFATETLAVGVNLPARSVVVERLTRFTGERHEVLTPGQFTQLTGRAGRRGMDAEGHALILWSPFVSFDTIARLVSSTEFPLRSAFRPTYNMVANLMDGRSREQAEDLLRRSFGQFQLDRRIARRRERQGGRQRGGEAPDGLVDSLGALLEVLGARGMVDGWALTDKGLPLVGIYNEADLLIVEALAAGIFENLDPPGLAAVLSALTYRHRGPVEPEERSLHGPAGRRLTELEGLWADLAAAEEAAGLEALPQPDPGFARVVLSWTAGRDLADVLGSVGEHAFTGGEFVRNVRLVADLLRQVAKVGPSRVARVARQAVGELERGVVSLTREGNGETDDDSAPMPEDTAGGTG